MKYGDSGKAMSGDSGGYKMNVRQPRDDSSHKTPVPKEVSGDAGDLSHSLSGGAKAK